MGLKKLQESCKLLDKAVSKELPGLSQHLQSLEITATLYATPWLMALFVTTQLQHTTLLAIWDLLLLSDNAEQLLIQVALGLLSLVQEEIRSMGKGRRKRGTCDFDETMHLREVIKRRF